MSKMYKTVNKTFNPFTGCFYECYGGGCWAKRLAEGRLKGKRKYKNGFAPTFHPEEFKRKFRAGDFVAVSLMGDIKFATERQRQEIYDYCAAYPEVKFLLQTKAPYIFLSQSSYPDNVYLATTLETNRDYQVTKAPPPFDRYRNLAIINHSKKFVSIEPVMDFDVYILVTWIRNIQPGIVEIGADNYNNALPEPSWDNVQTLLDELRRFVPRVIEKDGLERLKKE
jgi:hypothetical protein